MSYHVDRLVYGIAIFCGAAGIAILFGLFVTATMHFGIGIPVLIAACLAVSYLIGGAVTGDRP